MNSSDYFTVRDLMDALAALVDENPAALGYPVEAEGCDCIGLAHGIEVDQYWPWDGVKEFDPIPALTVKRHID